MSDLGPYPSHKGAVQLLTRQHTEVKGSTLGSGCYETLGRSFAFSAPPSFHLQNGNNDKLQSCED